MVNSSIEDNTQTPNHCARSRVVSTLLPQSLYVKASGLRNKPTNARCPVVSGLALTRWPWSKQPLSSSTGRKQEEQVGNKKNLYLLQQVGNHSTRQLFFWAGISSGAEGVRARLSSSSISSLEHELGYMPVQSREAGPARRETLSQSNPPFPTHNT